MTREETNYSEPRLTTGIIKPEMKPIFNYEPNLYTKKEAEDEIERLAGHLCFWAAVGCGCIVFLGLLTLI